MNVFGDDDDDDDDESLYHIIDQTKHLQIYVQVYNASLQALN